MFQETEAFSSIQIAEFTGYIKSTILTVVKLMPNQRIVRGMNIRGPGVAVGTVIVGEVATSGIFGKSTPKGGPGRYVVSLPQTVGTSAALIDMRGTLVSGTRMPEPIKPGSSLVPLPPPPTVPAVPSGSSLPPLPMTHPLYPLTQMIPPAITPSTVAQAGFSWPRKPFVPPPPPPPPPPSGGGPASTDHQEMLDFLQNENRTNMSELERLRAEFSKSQSIYSTEPAVIRAVDKYIGNMSLYRDDITRSLDSKVIPNLQVYRRSHEGRKGPLDNLRLLIEAMNNRMKLYNKLAEDIKNGSVITVARIKEEIASANSLVTKYESAYNATGRADEVPFNVSQDLFEVRIQRPLPLLEFPSSAGPGPSSAGPGSSTNTSPSWGIPLTRSKNPALYDQIVANPNPAIWELILKAYNPPFLYPTDLPTTTTTSTLRSISGFSDYKGKIASWTESFAPFEN